MINAVFQALADAAQRGEPVVLGIISGAKGSSPQKIGAKALFYSDGRIVGTLGGGCLEAEIQKRAITSLRDQQPASFNLLLDHDFGWDDGLICGGSVEGLILPNAQAAGPRFWSDLAQASETRSWGVTQFFRVERLQGANVSEADDPSWLYQETITPPCSLWIAGAGHIARAVAPLALQVDFDVTVFDDRPMLLTHEFFPTQVRLKAGTWDQLLSTPMPDVPGFGLIVTRGHRHDALVLENWVHKPFLFLGMIGSKRKARTIFEHFAQEELASAEDLARVACPVGVEHPVQNRPGNCREHHRPVH